MTSSPDFVVPAYDDRSLADVLPAVARALGHPLESDTERGEAPGLAFPEARSYVVLLVDGLGEQLLAAHPDDAPFLASLLPDAQPATAGVPSTTATSLTSLGTGMTPSRHGMVGFTSRIPGTDQLLQALRWNKNVSSQDWQPHPTVFGRLSARGVHTVNVTKREFVGSGLTDVSTRGAEAVGADAGDDRTPAANPLVE